MPAPSSRRPSASQEPASLRSSPDSPTFQPLWPASAYHLAHINGRHFLFDKPGVSLHEVDGSTADILRAATETSSTERLLREAEDRGTPRSDVQGVLDDMAVLIRAARSRTNRVRPQDRHLHRLPDLRLRELVVVDGPDAPLTPAFVQRAVSFLLTGAATLTERRDARMLIRTEDRASAELLPDATSTARRVAQQANVALQIGLQVPSSWIAVGCESAPVFEWVAREDVALHVHVSTSEMARCSDFLTAIRKLALCLSAGVYLTVDVDGPPSDNADALMVDLARCGVKALSIEPTLASDFPAGERLGVDGPSATSTETWADAWRGPFERLAQEIASQVIRDRTETRLAPWSILTRLLREEHKLEYSDGAAITRLAVDRDGAIYPLPEMIGEPRRVIGTLDDGIDEARRVSFFERIDEAKAPCRACWLQRVCAGGPVRSLDTDGDRFLPRSTSNCALISTLMEVAIYLHVLIAEARPDLLPPSKDPARPVRLTEGGYGITLLNP